MFLLNVAGINPGLQSQSWKLKALREEIELASAFTPFIVLTETHLKSYHFDGEVQMEDYIIYRGDRPKREKGGVAIFLHNSFAVSTQDKFGDGFSESVMIFLPRANLVLAAIYRPPRCPDASFKSCLDKISSFCSQFTSP